MPASRSGARTASACIWRRAWTATTWATAIRLATFTYVARELGKRGLAFLCPRGVVERANLATAGTPARCALATASGPRSRTHSAASISPMKALPSKARQPRWPMARPTPWPSASSPSPIPTCRSVSRKARRSMHGTRSTFYSGGASRLCRLSGARGGTGLNLATIWPFMPTGTNARRQHVSSLCSGFKHEAKEDRQ